VKSPFHFECFDISQDALHAFCQALAGLDRIRLGAGSALCAGELQWADESPIRAHAITPKQFTEWCAKLEHSKLPEYEQVWPKNGQETSIAPEQPATTDRAVELTIEAVEPLLVASGLDRAEKDERTGQKTDEYTDELHVLMTKDGHIRIPASSLRGALRARARKILILWIRECATRQSEQNRPATTIGDSAAGILMAGKQAEKMLEHVFGSTNCASTLQMSDFLSEETFSSNQLHHQHFNAIDRFTGGVAKGALYEASAAPIGTRFNGRILFRPGRSIPSWARLLLGLVLRDLSMADLQIGWGKAKGYGTIKLILGDNKVSKLIEFELEDGDEWLMNAISSKIESSALNQLAYVEEQQVLPNDQ